MHERRWTALSGIRVRSARARWWLRRVVVAVIVVAAQWMLIHVPSVAVGRFEQSAVEVLRTAHWRYGYIQQRHGIAPVRTARTVGEPPFSGPAQADLTGRRLSYALRQAPKKAVAELVFYAVLYAVWHLGRRRSRRVATLGGSRLLQYVAAILLALEVVSVAMGPFLVLGYGAPVFGASFGLVAQDDGTFALAPLPDLTVSYVILLQAVVLLPRFVADFMSGLGFRSPFDPPATLWMTTVICWSAASVLVAWTATPLRRRERAFEEPLG